MLERHSPLLVSVICFLGAGARESHSDRQRGTSEEWGGEESPEKEEEKEDRGKLPL